MYFNRFYYNVKPLIPRSLQIILRRQIALRKLKSCNHIWPTDEKAGKTPEGWAGWPGQKRFALVLTHDVETEVGHNRCHQLIELEETLGFRSSFYFVPESYSVSQDLLNELTRKGFEVGVHGLIHDGKLYSSKKVFQERAGRIDRYLEEWGAVGFRSPAMHHNLDWIHDLNIEYDASTFDTDPFEPQSEGMGTVFPFLVSRDGSREGYVELPYTLPQDFTLFVLLKERGIDIWKEKLDWIAKNGGMALLNTHPDYMNFDGKKLRMEEYPAKYYEEFLLHIRTRHKGEFWHVLPKDMSRFWANNLGNRTNKLASSG